MDEKYCNYEKCNASNESSYSLDFAVSISMIDILWLECKSDGDYQYCSDYSIEKGMYAVCYQGKAICENASNKFKSKDRDDGYK